MSLDPPEVVVEPAPTRANRVALLAIGGGFLLVLAALIAGTLMGTSGEPVGDAHDPIVAACRDARDDLIALDRIPDDVTADQLADRLDAETAILRSLVDELRQARTGNDAGQRALEGWISDWERLLDARERATARTRDEDVVPDFWLPPAEEGEVEGIDGRMDEYARREELHACTTDVLEADNLDGVRTYRDIEK